MKNSNGKQPKSRALSLRLHELKAVKQLDEIHMAQCMNYLKATGLKVCLLINFGKPKIEIKRIVNQF